MGILKKNDRFHSLIFLRNSQGQKNVYVNCHKNFQRNSENISKGNVWISKSISKEFPQELAKEFWMKIIQVIHNGVAEKTSKRIAKNIWTEIQKLVISIPK